MNPESLTLVFLIYSSGVGQNRRYQLVERDVERAGQAAERQARAVSLTVDQVRSSGPRVEATEPVQVTAWVSHQVAYVEERPIEAEAIAWTRGAVLVRWIVPDTTYPVHAWVWANAVIRRT